MGKTVLTCKPWFKHEATIYWAFTHIENPESLANVTLAQTVHVADYQIWHRRLGHLNEQALMKMPQCPKSFLRKIQKRKNRPVCSGCMEGKMVLRSFPESESRAKENFELIHSDLKSLPIASYHKYRYFIVFIDDKSSGHWIQCLKLKSDTKKAIKQFEALVRVQYKKIIHQWCIDGGGRICKSQFRRYTQRSWHSC